MIQTNREFTNRKKLYYSIRVWNNCFEGNKYKKEVKQLIQDLEDVGEIKVKRINLNDQAALLAKNYKKEHSRRNVRKMLDLFALSW